MGWEMSDLVKRLCDGKHPVAVEQYEDANDLKGSIDREFVLVKFTGTKGGTELGFKLDAALSKLDDCDFEKGMGVVRLVGDLSLDFEKVRCIADIDISKMQGEGHLEILT